MALGRVGAPRARGVHARPPPIAVRRELARRAVRDELARRLREDTPDLATFIQERTPTYVEPYWLAPILEIYERIRDGEELKVVVQAPPRHGKTDLTLHALAWLLCLDPGRTHAFTTYADALARSKSRKARRLAREAGVPISAESSSANEWRTTLEGGLLATGVGGPLTGHGITGVGVVDDPIKNRQEAESRLIRDRVWDWYDDVFSSRLEPGSSEIIQATRWHEDDLSGRLLDAGEHELVSLPAIAEDDALDSLGRKPGEPLWPERYSLERLEKVRELRPFTFASLYQQRPRPRGEYLFGPPRFYDPADFWRQTAGHGLRFIAGLDTAYAGKTRSDHSAVVEAAIWADPRVDGEPRAYVTRVIITRAKVTELGKILETLRTKTIRWRLYGAEHGTGDFLEEHHGIWLERDTQVVDKYAYAMPAATAWNQGWILLPGEAGGGESRDPDVLELLREARSFTGDDDPRDDAVDALASMWAEAMLTLPSDAAARALAGL
jgi:hypothetical protein